MSNLDPYRDLAQQMVTCLLDGDRSLPTTIVKEAAFPDVLALVLADLCAFVHTSWGQSLGLDAIQRREGWTELMLDVAEWRTRA